jgi:hypothetical protein
MIERMAKVLKLEKILGRYLDLDRERSIWVGEEELGTERVLEHGQKSYRVKIPPRIHKKVTLRLRGLGKSRGKRTGDLLLHVWLNKGIDIRKSLWLSESAARQGAEKLLRVGAKEIRVVIPPRSCHGMQLRLKGLGHEPDFTGRAPPVHLKRGNLLVKLLVYPDGVTPRYGSFDALTTGDMVLEGWVYRKIDQVIDKIGESLLAVEPVRGDAVADVYNVEGWHGIFALLRGHLRLNHVNVWLKTSGSISLPGSCERTAIRQSDGSFERMYAITLNEQLLDNPFAIAAILAHELCHVVYSERFEDPPVCQGYGFVVGHAEDLLEMERTVDLLVFMFKIGEFQIRVSRDQRLTIGYFNQNVFDRMQVIVSKKLGQA